MKKIEARIKFLHPEAKKPRYGSEEAAGFDLYSIEEKTIEPGTQEVFKTGVSLEIEPGYCWQFWDRSGHAAKGITFLGGLIDSDYRGELKVILRNHSAESIKIEKGDRIIQVVPVPIVKAEFIETQKLRETDRGEGGFGSTGVK